MKMKGEASIAGSRQHRRCASLFFFWNRTFYQCCNLVKQHYGILQSGYYRSADSRCCHRRGPWRLGRCEPHGRVRKRQPWRKCLCLVKKQNQNTSIDSSLPLFRSLKELAKICYNFQNSRTFDVAKPLYIMKGGLERYGFGRTI